MSYVRFSTPSPNGKYSDIYAYATNSHYVCHGCLFLDQKGDAAFLDKNDFIDHMHLHKDAGHSCNYDLLFKNIQKDVEDEKPKHKKRR